MRFRFLQTPFCLRAGQLDHSSVQTLDMLGLLLAPIASET